MFRGIPYAAPPVGARRWRAPEPPAPWDGIRDARRHGDVCAQWSPSDDAFRDALLDGLGLSWWRRALLGLPIGVAPAAPESEDCLTLSVRGSAFGGALRAPVMVWIHGGDHQAGAGSAALFQTDALVREGVVLVAINYRLGVLGYFAHPALRAESAAGVSGNYGTLDQIRALRWVQSHIGAFGGDPDRVTIFGQSAGGQSVAHLLMSPPARGLFQRAILQSPASARPRLTLARAEEEGRAFAARVVGAVADPIEGLRALPARELFEAQSDDPALAAGVYPVLDDQVLPWSAAEAFLAGEIADVPILVGSNADDGSLIQPLLGTLLPGEPAPPRPGYAEWLGARFGPDADLLQQVYPADSDEIWEHTKRALLGDAMFSVAARFYAASAARHGRAAYLYRFTVLPASPQQTAGAYHSAELPLLFDAPLPLVPPGAQTAAVGAAMRRYWTRFAKTGDPNATDDPPWEPYHPYTSPRLLILGPATGMAPVPNSAVLNVLERWGLQPSSASRSLASTE